MINNNFQRILIKFGLWLVTGILICLVGITGVFADTYDATQFVLEAYDNYGPSLSHVTTNFTNNSWRWEIPSMVANSAGTAFIFNSPIPLIANHTYTVSVEVENSWGIRIKKSTYDRVGVGTNIANAKSSYENNTNVNEIYSGGDTNTTIQFAFTPTINGTWVCLPFATVANATNITFTISRLIVDDLGSTGVSQSEINNSLNNQTNIINNSITNSENNIINNQNANNDALINNDNENTQKIIDENKKNFNTETDCENLSSLDSYSFGSGNYFEQRLLLNNYKRNTTYTLSFDITTDREPFEVSIGYGDTYYAVDGPRKQGFNSGHIVFTFTTTLSDNDYNKFKNLWIRIPRYSSTGVMWNANVSNIMLIEGSSEKTYCKYGTKVITNKLDEQKNAINNLDNTLKDDNVDDNGIADAFDDFNDYLDDNSTITQLITLPITLYTAILNNINGTCSPFNLGKLYGEDLILPCINISQYLGNSLWSMIDIIISGFAVYAISKKMIKVFNNFSSLREGDVIDD